MSRWIAFDEESTAAAACRTRMAVSFQRGDAMAFALSSGKPAIVVLPGARAGEVLLLSITRNVQPRSEPVAYEASGFLGLSDAPVYEEAPPKKRWWQKILD
jgi:hypothetical protein